MFTYKHLPRFKKVCFCCPLRIGNIILVYVNLILSLSICFIYLLLDFTKFVIRIFNSDWDVWLHKMIRYKTIPLVLAIMIIAYGVAEICMSVVILIGHHKKKYGLILKYMYYTIFITIMMALNRIFDMENHIWYLEIGPDLVYYAFKLYYILSIRSQIKLIQELEADVVYVRNVKSNPSEADINDMDLNKQNGGSVKIMINYDVR